MVYTFLKFTLDTDKKELHFNGNIVPLTKQSFELLLFFVKSPDKVLSKDDIIDAVWKGRYVTENSIDQSISKLRKILNSVKKETYIKTAYGKGFIFVPEVSEVVDEENKSEKKGFSGGIFILAAISLLIVVSLIVSNRNKPIKQEGADSLLLIMSSNEANEDDAWLNQGSTTFIDQIFGFANAADLKDYKLKPEYLDRQQYIENQWEISPELKVVTTHVKQQDSLFTIQLNIMGKLHQQKIQSFTDQNLGRAMKAASEWLAKEVDRASSIEKIDALIPKDSYLLELYMRGLASINKGQIDKAEHFFQLCIEEKPDFYLARLQLADVKSKQGQLDKSLAILDTLSEIAVFPQIEIELEGIRADIYDTQGKLDQARDLYLSLLQKYADQPLSQLNTIRYDLSYTYASLTEYDKALTELNKLETSIDESNNAELLANVLQKKASILQKLGHTKLAQESAEKALNLFSKLEDLLGEAKIYTTLARITTHQSKYKESINHLEKALFLNKSLNYKLGVGATLNELIYVLMVKGEFARAWESNLEMQDIAIDIDYNAMLQISKQYAIEIARAQKKWVQSELYLKEHLQMAQASNNKRALIKNKLMALNLYLDQEKTENIETLIDEVQKHIDETQEIRLQPRINMFLGRYYFLVQKSLQAETLLLSSKNLAKETEDGETIIEINNILAEHYLTKGKAQKVLAILEESYEFKPLPYPFLLLKSKANQLLGNLLKSLEYANECKNTANEWWSLEDERYLVGLKQSVQ